MPGPASADGRATAALVVGIVGFCIPLLGGIASIILGTSSRKRIDSSAGRLSGRGMAVAGVVLGAVQIFAWVALIALSLLGRNGTVTIGKPRLATDVVRIGQCFDTDGSQGNVVPKVRDCSKPHLGELFHQFELADAPGAAYPGEKEIVQKAFDACQGPFKDFVGADYGTSKLDIFVLGPNNLSWGKLDDRTIQCAASRLDGSPLTGSVQGSGM
jgi:hypothetical protein